MDTEGFNEIEILGGMIAKLLSSFSSICGAFCIVVHEWGGRSSEE
jgi:hypothetical protein